MTKTSLTFVRTIWSLLLSASLWSAPAYANETSIVENLLSSGQHKELLDALTKSGLLEMLKAPGRFTVFVPSDEALKKTAWRKLDREKLHNLLTYHIIGRRLVRGDLAQKKQLKSVENVPILVEAKGMDLVLNRNVHVSGEGAVCSNGVFYMVDQVLKPPAVTSPNM